MRGWLGKRFRRFRGSRGSDRPRCFRYTQLFPFRKVPIAMPLTRFHPVVQRWFSSTLGQPTAAQARGWESIFAGRHTLIAAPTGSGKTLAAFLTAIDELTREGLSAPLRDEVRVALRVAAQGAERGHPQEPGRAATRHPAARRRSGTRRRRGSPPPCARATRRRPSARRCCGRRRTSSSRRPNRSTCC